MRSNTEIVRDALEKIVNQKRIDAWDEYFSPDYVSRGASFIGLGFTRDSSGEQHIIRAVLPGSPAEGKLEAGDKILWIEDGQQRWDTHESISKGLQCHQGSKLRVGVQRGEESLDVELHRTLIAGLETGNDQAKSEMRDFMTREIPDLRVDIQLTLADEDKVVCLMEYRGTHASFNREANWREIWIARLFEGKIVESWPLPDIDAYCKQLGFQITPPST